MDDFLTQSAVAGTTAGIALLLAALGIYGVVGLMVATRTRVCGLWWLNACRVVALEDGAVGGRRRFGFAYATLEGHVERGEERFRVELDGDGAVWYELAAVSRPAHWLTRLAYPWVRRLQRRFALDSLDTMARATATEEEDGT